MPQLSSPTTRNLDGAALAFFGIAWVTALALCYKVLLEEGNEGQNPNHQSSKTKLTVEARRDADVASGCCKHHCCESADSDDYLRHGIGTGNEACFFCGELLRGCRDRRCIRRRLAAMKASERGCFFCGEKSTRASRKARSQLKQCSHVKEQKKQSARDIFSIQQQDCLHCQSSTHSGDVDTSILVKRFSFVLSSDGEVSFTASEPSVPGFRLEKRATVPDLTENMIDDAAGQPSSTQWPFKDAAETLRPLPVDSDVFGRNLSSWFWVPHDGAEARV